jgi:hypothetical protein
VGGALLALVLVPGLVLGTACLSRRSAPSGADAGAAGPTAYDPERPGLAFALAPASVRLNRRFELHVRINDERGQRNYRDHRTQVSVRASGKGTLSGTLTRRAVGGLVQFDDLRYDQWEEIVLEVRADDLGTLSTADIPVRPTLRFAEPPPYRVRTGGPLGPLKLELVDGQGNLVESETEITLSASDAGLEAAKGRTRALDNGRVTYDDVVLRREGPVTLSFSGPGIPVLVHGLTAHSARRVEAVWLPGGRVGVPYRAQLGKGCREFRITGGLMPRGLKLSPTGEIAGIPVLPGHARFEAVSIDVDVTEAARVWRVDLSIFPEQEKSTRSLDDLDVPGPYAVGRWDTSVPGVGGKARRVRFYFPSPKEQVASAKERFPMVVFHHGLAPVLAGAPDPFLRFEPLLGRWASHGAVVATVDGLDLVWSAAGYTADSFNNLKGISENQRAALTWVRARVRGRSGRTPGGQAGQGDADFPLADQVDLGRLIVAGHSRGAAASLITLRAEPTVVGAILIKPTDPVITVGGERSWSGRLPAKPVLLGMAERDLDVVYPVADLLYERRGGPTSAHTILGSIHGFSCIEPCGPEENDNPAILRRQDWAITNAYAVAFINYVGRGDLGYAPLLFGPEALSTRLSSLGVLVRADRGAAALWVEDFQDDVEGRNNLGLPSGTRGTVWTEELAWLAELGRPLGDEYPFVANVYARPEMLAFTRARLVEWASDGAVFFSDLGGLDVRGRGAFVFRALSLTGPIPGGHFELRFRDGQGGTATFKGAQHVGRNGIGSRFSDIIVPMAALKGARLDLTDLERFELVLSGSGKILLDDLRFE